MLSSYRAFKTKLAQRKCVFTERCRNMVAVRLKPVYNHSVGTELWKETWNRQWIAGFYHGNTCSLCCAFQSFFGDYMRLTVCIQTFLRFSTFCLPQCKTGLNSQRLHMGWPYVLNDSPTLGSVRPSSLRATPASSDSRNGSSLRTLGILNRERPSVDHQFPKIYLLFFSMVDELSCQTDASK
jgi:hypothetical protein